MPLLEATRQIRIPRDQDHAARALKDPFLPPVPEGHEIRFVGIKQPDLPLERTEPAGVLLVRQGDELLHGGRVEQIAVVTVGQELFLGRRGLGAFPVHLHREG